MYFCNMIDNTLNIYLDEIGAKSLLSEDEERRLAARIHAGDERALNKLIEANLRFVVAIARQYQNKGLPIDDLISEGNIGLMKAARKYDGERGVRFVNYAVVFVRQQIEKALKLESAELRVENMKDVRDDNSPAIADDVEFSLDSLNERERKVVTAYFGIGQERLTMAEIAEDMNLRRERVRQIRNKAIRRLKKNKRIKK
jgi:RNA polymerase primary sigma factor